MFSIYVIKLLMIKMLTLYLHIYLNEVSMQNIGNSDQSPGYCNIDKSTL